MLMVLYIRNIYPILLIARGAQTPLLGCLPVHRARGEVSFPLVDFVSLLAKTVPIFLFLLDPPIPCPTTTCMWKRIEALFGWN